MRMYLFIVFIDENPIWLRYEEKNILTFLKPTLFSDMKHYLFVVFSSFNPGFLSDQWLQLLIFEDGEEATSRYILVFKYF